MHVTESCNGQEEALNSARRLADPPSFPKSLHTQLGRPMFPLKLQDPQDRRICSDNPLQTLATWSSGES